MEFDVAGAFGLSGLQEHENPDQIIKGQRKLQVGVIATG
jgi:hypothetical protein